MEDDLDFDKWRIPEAEMQRIEAAQATKTKGGRRAAKVDNLIGCPMWWWQRVLPLVNTKGQLTVAIYLWRRRIVCGGRATFDLPNGELKSLGITRKVKYQTLNRLAAADVIRVARGSAKEAPLVTILTKAPMAL
jgi:hypothetical protein